MKTQILFISLISLLFCSESYAHNAKGSTRRINKRTTLLDTHRTWTELWSLDLRGVDGDFMQVAIDLEVQMRECRTTVKVPCTIRKGKKILQLRPEIATVRMVVVYPHPTKPNAFATASIDKPLKSLITQGNLPFKRDWTQTVHMSVNIPHLTNGEAIVRVMGIQNDTGVPSLPIIIRNLTTLRISK